MKKSIHHAEHYIWGDHCDGWHLVKTDTLSVIQEQMPPGTAEEYHFHERAQQLFYILAGQAHFEIEGNTFTVDKGEAIHVLPLQKHAIRNEGRQDLIFLVISEPKSHGDRKTVTKGADEA